eukprot:TRINITY_DN511_c0_g1_i1.p1 TRINITY_DN511_c0_g1~~TRINITY_DN511_c0_g1_i1.p1  ORF type:complete len:220 (+),score=34.00 TRINITY_DN511_c0_g1_i1:297-956(+)
MANRLPQRSAPMSINGGSQPHPNEAGLSQSCPPIKPSHIFKVPAREPEPFNLPQSISEHEELSFSQPVPMNSSNNEDDNADEEGPGRSFIRTEGFENISAEEFNSNQQERDVFLSQSCPTWGSMELPDFPPRSAKEEVQVAPPEVEESVGATEISFAKLSFQNLAEMGRSPTIFESLKFVSATDLHPPELMEEVDEGDSTVQEADEADDVPFDMDDDAQ